MIRKSLALFLLAALMAPVAHAQSLDDVLAKHFQARGGLDKLKKLESVRLMGHMEVGPGLEAPVTMDRKRPAKQRMEFVFSGMTGVQAFDGTRGWGLMPFMGQTTAEAQPAEENQQTSEDADFDGPLVDPATKGITLALAGKEAVDGADAYKISVTHKSGRVEYFFIDAETYLIVKRSGKQMARGTEMETETAFGNYKEVNGLMFPCSMAVGAKGSDHSRTIVIDSIAVDVPMDDAHFAMPADTSKHATPPTKPEAAPKKKK